MRLLLLEDDRRLRSAYANRLKSVGGDVAEVGTLADAQRALGETDFDCLVLDRLVPDGDAVSLVGAMDQRLDRPPVLMISGLAEPAERLEGLRIGADDYLGKPFHLEELALRVRKLVDAGPPCSGVLELGHVRLDRHRRNVTCDGARVHLTPTEYRLLEKLALNVGSLVPIDDLYDHCWGTDRPFQRERVHRQVWRLRQILDDASPTGGHLTIESTRCVGYTLRTTG